MSSSPCQPQNDELSYWEKKLKKKNSLRNKTWKCIFPLFVLVSEIRHHIILLYDKWSWIYCKVRSQYTLTRFIAWHLKPFNLTLIIKLFHASDKCLWSVVYVYKQINGECRKFWVIMIGFLHGYRTQEGNITYMSQRQNKRVLANNR